MCLFVYPDFRLCFILFATPARERRGPQKTKIKGRKKVSFDFVSPPQEA